MNLYNLKIFVDAAKNKSMSASGQINHLSRPAVSQAIRNLESDLGVELIQHRPRTFELTPCGELLVENSKSIFREVEFLEASLHNGNKNLVGTIRVGCVRSLTTRLLPRVLADFYLDYPRVSFKVAIDNSETLINKLSENEIDLALTLGDDTLHGAKETVIEKGSFALIAPRGVVRAASFGQRKTLPLKFALTERRPETERAKTLFLRKYSKELPIFAEVASWDTILSWVQQGYCGGLVPRFLLSKEEERIEILIDKVFPYEIKTIAAPKKTASELIQKLLLHFTKLNTRDFTLE